MDGVNWDIRPYQSILTQLEAVVQPAAPAEHHSCRLMVRNMQKVREGLFRRS